MKVPPQSDCSVFVADFDHQDVVPDMSTYISADSSQRQLSIGVLVDSRTAHWIQERPVGKIHFQYRYFDLYVYELLL